MINNQGFVKTKSVRVKFSIRVRFMFRVGVGVRVWTRPKSGKFTTISDAYRVSDAGTIAIVLHYLAAESISRIVMYKVTISLFLDNTN